MRDTHTRTRGSRTGRARSLAIGLVTIACLIALAPAASAAPKAVATSTVAPKTKLKTVPYGSASQPLSGSASKAATVVSGYDMGITVATYAQSGCMVCHGDRALVRLVNGKLVSYYIDPQTMVGSAHKDILCTGCHVDFVFKSPHTNRDWRAEAKDSCKNCHKKEYDDYRVSAHAQDARPGDGSATLVAAKNKRRPLCGDCHQGHSIERLKGDPAAQARLHAQGEQMCGDCHTAKRNSYDDYYHGAAYRRGAADAPACWQCHGAHKVLPSKDRQSPTNPTNLAQTCGHCHKGVDEGYTRYASFIHGRDKTYKENPVYAIYRSVYTGVTETMTGIIGTVRSWFGSSST